MNSYVMVSVYITFQMSSYILLCLYIFLDMPVLLIKLLLLSLLLLLPLLLVLLPLLLALLLLLLLALLLLIFNYKIICCGLVKGQFSAVRRQPIAKLCAIGLFALTLYLHCTWMCKYPKSKKTWFDQPYQKSFLFTAHVKRLLCNDSGASLTKRLDRLRYQI